jgi:hypothetical protein
VRANPEIEARRIANMNEANAKPDVLARRKASMRKTSARPDVLNRLLATLAAVRANPEIEARRIANSKATNARPDVAKRRNEAIRAGYTEGVRKRLSDKMTKMSADPGYIARRDAGKLRHARQMVGRTMGGRRSEDKKWEAADKLHSDGSGKTWDDVAEIMGLESSGNSVRKCVAEWKKRRECLNHAAHDLSATLADVQTPQ